MLFDNFSAIDNHNIGDFYGLLRGLWNDPGIKEAFERRSEFHLPDSMGYFYDHLDRIIVPDYVPTQQVYIYVYFKKIGPCIFFGNSTKIEHIHKIFFRTFCIVAKQPKLLTNLE